MYRRSYLRSVRIESRKYLTGPGTTHHLLLQSGESQHPMKPQTRESMEQLFTARWNVPQAADHCGLTWKEMKITFSEYCRLNPPTYTNP